MTPVAVFTDACERQHSDLVCGISGLPDYNSAYQSLQSTLSSPRQQGALPDGMIRVHLAQAHRCPHDPTRLTPLGSSDVPERVEKGETDNRLSMLVDVNVDQECLVGHIAPDSGTSQVDAISAALTGLHSRSLSRTEVLDSLTVVLRLPLLLSSAWRPRTRQGPNGERMYVLAISRPEMPEQFRRMQPVNVCQAIPSDVTGTWFFECSSEDDLQELFAQLQLAGCFMQNLADRYRVNQLAGVGSSAKVFLADDLRTGEMVAVKVALKQNPEKDMTFLREITILRWMRAYPTVLQFRGAYQTEDPMTQQQVWAIVTEFVGGGELFEAVYKNGPLPEHRARYVMLQLLSAINFLHQRGVVHRDIKTENVVLVGHGDEIRLVDFGLAAVEWDTEVMQMRCGSPGYVAPEVLCGERYGRSVDCFSLGVLMYILLVGYGPFRGHTVEVMLSKNLKCRVNYKKLAHVSAEGTDLVKGLLQADPANRISAGQALDHPWFSLQLSKSGQLGKAESSSSPPERERDKSGIRPGAMDSEDITSFDALETARMTFDLKATDLSPANSCKTIVSPRLSASFEKEETHGSSEGQHRPARDTFSDSEDDDDENDNDEACLSNSIRSDQLRTTGRRWRCHDRYSRQKHEENRKHIEDVPPARVTAFFNRDLDSGGIYSSEQDGMDMERISAFFTRDLGRMSNASAGAKSNASLAGDEERISWLLVKKERGSRRTTERQTFNQTYTERHTEYSTERYTQFSVLEQDTWAHGLEANMDVFTEPPATSSGAHAENRLEFRSGRMFSNESSGSKKQTVSLAAMARHRKMGLMSGMAADQEEMQPIDSLPSVNLDDSILTGADPLLTPLSDRLDVS